MEDDKIKELFKSFDPELSSDSLFMNKLQRNMESMEIVKQRQSEAKSLQRKALSVALVVGFVIGFLFARILPYIGRVIADINVDTSLMKFVGFSVDYQIIIWLVAATAATLVSVNAYELTLSLLSRK